MATTIDIKSFTKTSIIFIKNSYNNVYNNCYIKCYNGSNNDCNNVCNNDVHYDNAPTMVSVTEIDQK